MQVKGRAVRPRISFNAANSQKLICIMYKYFVPEMLYKLNLHYTDSALKSVRCSLKSIKVANYILQHTPSKEDDIV